MDKSFWQYLLTIGTRTRLIRQFSIRQAAPLPLVYLIIDPNINFINYWYIKILVMVVAYNTVYRLYRAFWIYIFKLEYSIGFCPHYSFVDEITRGLMPPRLLSFEQKRALISSFKPKGVGPVYYVKFFQANTVIHVLLMYSFLAPIVLYRLSPHFSGHVIFGGDLFFWALALFAILFLGALVLDRDQNHAEADFLRQHRDDLVRSIMRAFPEFSDAGGTA